MSNKSIIHQPTIRIYPAVGAQANLENLVAELEEALDSFGYLVPEISRAIERIKEFHSFLGDIYDLNDAIHRVANEVAEG